MEKDNDINNESDKIEEQSIESTEKNQDVDELIEKLKETQSADGEIGEMSEIPMEEIAKSEENNTTTEEKTDKKNKKSSSKNKASKQTPPENDDLEQLETVTVQPVEFASFDEDENPSGEENSNLEMLLDIKLGLTVELGRCELPIKKILELTRDSIVELDKIAGEPVSLYANGKHIANGEVVVIEDNFGLRITSILEPEKRLKSLG